MEYDIKLFPSEGNAIELQLMIFYLPFEDHLAMAKRKTHHLSMDCYHFSSEERFFLVKRSGKRYSKSHQLGFAGTPTTRTAASWMTFWEADRIGEDDLFQK